jgi:hypothetical protein
MIAGNFDTCARACTSPTNNEGLIFYHFVLLIVIYNLVLIWSLTDTADRTSKIDTSPKIALSLHLAFISDHHAV